MAILHEDSHLLSINVLIWSVFDDPVSFLMTMISTLQVANYVIDGLTISKLDTNRVVKYSTIISFVVTLVLGLCLVVTIVWLLKPGHGLIYRLKPENNIF